MFYKRFQPLDTIRYQTTIGAYYIYHFMRKKLEDYT